MNKSKSKSSFLLFILVFYVMLQLTWWGYLLLQLNKEVAKYKIENSTITTTSLTELKIENQLQQNKLNNKMWMIFGEGSVFILILAFGVSRLLKIMNAEIDLNRRQHNFLLSVTHELKSPIASVRLQLETVLKRQLEREKQDGIIKNAVADIDRLNALTDNILTATQLENTNFNLNKKNENVSQLLIKILNTIDLKKHKQKFETKIPENIHHNIDENAFVSITTNLIENALKYSGEDKLVKVDLSKVNDKLILTISDNGIGISDIEKKNIFKKFYRIGVEETRKTKGTGLGLFITKQLVEAHGGFIKVEDNKPVGTNFIVTL